MSSSVRTQDAARAPKDQHAIVHDAVNVADAVDDVLPLVHRSANDRPDRRQLSDDVELALRATGLNRIVMPARLGGLETPTAEAMEVFERIAAIDGSAGWCAVIGAGSNIFAGYLPLAGAGEVFDDPDRSSATMFAPLGTLDDDDGRLRLTGRWPFVSNCRHAEWIGLGAHRRRGGDLDPVRQLVFVRAEDVTIEDTWDAVGLLATGSDHVTADRLLVDPDHLCAFVGEPWADGPLWRLPVFSVILPLLAAVPLGIARGALDEIARQARDGRAGMHRGDLAGDPLGMADYAAAESRLVAARAALIDTVRDAHDRVTAGDAPDRRLLAQLYLANLHATETAVDVTSVAHRLGGGPAAYARSPLLRALNDVQTARQHYQFAHDHRIQLGKVLAGVDVTYPPYIT